MEHRYTWQGSTLIAEAYGDTILEFFYDESGQPYAMLVQEPDAHTNTTTETWYYYVTNLQGDVVAILDATGTLADLNPIRYRGYYYDTESRLYYLRSRYYDPALCRFINADSIASTGQGFLGANMFAYCRNKPVSRVDRRRT